MKNVGEERHFQGKARPKINPWGQASTNMTLLELARLRRFELRTPTLRTKVLYPLSLKARMVRLPGLEPGIPRL